MQPVDHSSRTQELNVIALANTVAVVDMVLHLVFHLWGWRAPRSYERSMAEFALGFQVKVKQGVGPRFFVFWAIEITSFWVFGAVIALLYNAFSRSRS